MLAVLGVVGILLLGVSIPRAEAGIGGSNTPTIPITVTVGVTFNANLTLINSSTPANDTESVVVTSLFITPSCADSASPICLAGNRDPGVFDVLPTAVGDASTPPCAGVSFTVGTPDAATGEVQLTPATTITLGPATAALASRSCQVNLQLRAKKLPSVPVVPGTGTTDALGRATLQGVVSGLNGTASGSAQTTVQPTTPTVATTSNPNTAGLLPGTSVSDTATVSGPAGAVTPTGTVAFFLCQPAQVTAAGCPAGGTQVGAAKTLVNGQATSDATNNTQTPGKYCWRAQYSGDTNYSAANHTDATVECFTIAPPPLEFSTQPTPNSGTVLLTALADVATLSGGSNPTGTITFSLFPPSDQGCAGTPIFVSVVNVNGDGSYTSATFPATSVTADGTYNWVAVYSGDANNPSASSACGQEPVVIKPPVVPTLSEWGMILFVMILVGVGALMLGRRRGNISVG
jgi:Bacterial Ig-like domain (group 3)/IPTL-CTERM motif